MPIRLPADVAAAVGKYRVAPTGASWSPDGGRIAFSEAGRIFLMSPSGGRVQRLTDGGF